MTVLNDCVCQHVGYCDGSCQHPEPASASTSAGVTEEQTPRVKQEADTFQDRVQPWMMACFGPEISADRVERADRLLEEVFELLQSGGYDPARVLSLRDYVWGREIGEPAQEVGGVQVTLAAYCLAHDLDMHTAGETELARIWTKVEKIRAKQAAKPTGSALPVASSPSPVSQKEAVPVGEVIELAGSLNDLTVIRWASGYQPAPGTKLYASPAPAPAGEPAVKAAKRAIILAMQCYDYGREEQDDEIGTVFRCSSQQIDLLEARAEIAARHVLALLSTPSTGAQDSASQGEA